MTDRRVMHSSSAEEDILTELRQYHWCEGEEWTCNNCRAADEIERLRRDYAILLERWRQADALIAELLLEHWIELHESEGQ